MAKGDAAVLYASNGGQESKSEVKPNFVVFLVDDQRHDTLGCAGHPILQTPNIDRLAREGVRFENAYVTTSICAASRASILTGLYERTHGFTFGTDPIRPKHARAGYPARLRAAGYETAFIGKWGVRMAKEVRNELFDTFQPLNRSPYFKEQPNGSKRHLTEIIGDRAVEFLSQRKKDQPFCLSLSFHAAHAEDGDKENHYPWPKAVDHLYGDVRMPEPRLAAEEIFAAQPKFLRKSLNRTRFFWRWDTPEKYQKNMRAYLRMLSGMDRVVGRVVQALESAGAGNNTILLYLSDNGYYMGDRGFAGKWSHYEESLRVPFIVCDPRLPKSARGRVRQEIVLNIDLAPTLLEWAGVPVPESYQGLSLLPLLPAKEGISWRKSFFCEHLMNHAGIPKWEGVHSERFVYARYFEQDPPYEFLHDLQKDPDQLQNFQADPEYQKALDSMRLRCEEMKSVLVAGGGGQK